MLGPSEIVHRLRLLSRGVSAPRIGGRRLAAYAAVGLALAVALAGVRLVYAGTKPADSGMRVLEFPSDRPMGSLYAPTREAEEPEWQMLAGGEHDRDYVAEAQGRIKVPQNARVRLVLSGVGVRDLSPLSRLGPDDLQQLEFPTWEPALLDDRGLAHLRGLTGLRVLQVYHSVVTDRGLESLRGLKSLRRLQMRSDRITDRGLEALKDLESLRALAISSKQLTDAGLARIAALQPLEILSVLSDRITDAGVAQLAELKSLRCLSLWSRGVRGPGLAHLAKIPALERLVFAGGYAKAGYVTDESLRYVSNIRSLKALDVSYCPITDAGMQYVGQMSQLEELNLNGTKVTSASLEHVKRLRSLKCLPGPFGGVKLAALQQLREMKSLEALSLHPSALCEQGVALLAELPRLRELEVKTPAHLVTSPTDKDLALLRRLPSLERLGVSCIRVTDEGLDHIAALKDLKSLNLWWCDLITDEGLAKLAALKSLEKLYLCRADHTPGLTTGGVSRLNELTRLRSLHINWAPLARTSPLDLTKLTALEWLWLEGDLRDDDLACLANLKRLNYLTLQGRFGDAGMAHLRNLGSPEVLQLTGKELTDKSLGAVAPLRSLYFLKLGAGRFTADGLRQLYGLKRLSQVTLVSETAIRPEAIRELAAQLPRTVIGGGPKVLARETRPPGMPTGERAPAFALRTLDGKNVRLEDYRGKVLLLHFWASWARESVADLPALKKLHQAFAANPDFAVLSISLDDDQAEARRVLQQHAPGWPQACVGRNAQVVRDYVAKLKPTSPSRYRLVGRDGAIWLPEFRSVTETDTGLTESHQLDVLVLHVNQALRATPTKTAD